MVFKVIALRKILQCFNTIETLRLRVSPLTTNRKRRPAVYGSEFDVWHSFGLRLRFTFNLCIMGYSQENKMAAALR